MQGKIPNPQKTTGAKLLSNDHVKAFFDAIGSGVGNTCSPNACKYGRILLLCDSDIDGLHSRNLLVSLCRLYLQPLVEAGLVGIIRAPAYRLQGSRGKHYLYSEAEKQQWLEQRNLSPGDESLTYFKGIAAMGSNEIFSLLLDKESRLETNLAEVPQPPTLKSLQEGQY